MLSVRFLLFEDFMAAANSPGNLTAEFTQDLDKVALPAMSVVQSSADRGPVCLYQVSGGLHKVPNTGRKERFEWNPPQSQQEVSFGRPDHYSSRLCGLLLKGSHSQSD